MTTTTTYEIGDMVFAVYHPRKGMLQSPIKDKIKDVGENFSPYSYILEKVNGFSDDDDDHWSNDWYGNLVKDEYLFRTESEANAFLKEYYTNELGLLKKRTEKIKAILKNLYTPEEKSEWLVNFCMENDMNSNSDDDLELAKKYFDESF